ncbi:hypothetical protein [Collinsella sp. An2]|uniref:hypothetical protein n=1 Tax=Collinsella sp. An2 TaxID=1965585 RepID=UPI000B581F7F|nr:hypothetical protein [Collinsella sp. An2]OUP06477.1 hypothetical protein B5F33_10080 [Collinsella sp. An2]
MANLEEMREFQKHWAAYRAGERELSLLKTRLPVNVAALTDEDLHLPMLADIEAMPRSASFDVDALAGALGPAVAQAAEAQADDHAWGWWLQENDWLAVAGLGALLRERASWQARLADLDTQAQAAIDADESYAKAVSTMSSYASANADDRATIQELEARRADPEQIYREAAEHDGKVPTKSGHRVVYIAVAIVGAVALAFVPVAVELRVLFVIIWLLLVGIAYVRPWTRPKGWLFKARRLKDELELIDGKISDAKSRVELRERETKRLDEESSARRTELLAPFEAPRNEAREAIRHAEESVLDLLRQDIASRDDTFEEDAFDGLGFDEAFAAANAREWGLLQTWMKAYVEALPEMVKRAEDVQASELVWLEGHAPFGKRYWPYTDTIVHLMETMRTDKSEAALKRFLREQAEREQDA